MPSIKDIQFERDLAAFRKATAGLIIPQPGKAHGLIPITRANAPPRHARGEPVGDGVAPVTDRQPIHVVKTGEAA